MVIWIIWGKYDSFCDDQNKYEMHETTRKQYGRNESSI